MPEFNKPYTYGTGRFTYELRFADGQLTVVNHQGGKVESVEAVRFHLAAMSQVDFRYI